MTFHSKLDQDSRWVRYFTLTNKKKLARVATEAIQVDIDLGGAEVVAAAAASFVQAAKRRKSDEKAVNRNSKLIVHNENESEHPEAGDNHAIPRSPEDEESEHPEAGDSHAIPESPEDEVAEEEETPLPIVLEAIDSDFGEFSRVIHQIHEIRSSSSEDKALSSIYWGAIDLRSTDSGGPLPENERGETFLPSETISKLHDHVNELLKDATKRISPSAVALLEVTKSINSTCDPRSGIHPIRLEDIQKAMVWGGIPKIVELLQAYLAKFEIIIGEVEDDEEDMAIEQVRALREQIQSIDPDDKETFWILSNLFLLDRIRWEPLKPTERTTDAYRILPFAMMDNVSLRYGDGESKADSDDKKRRQSSSTGKHVDYLHIIDGREFGSGESSRRALTKSDFIAGLKIRSLKSAVVARTAGSTINIRPILDEMLSVVCCPYYQAANGILHFRVLFNIGSELYAFQEWANVSLPAGDLESGLEMAEKFLICRHAMIRSHEAVRHAEHLLDEALLANKCNLRFPRPVGIRGKRIPLVLKRRSWPAPAAVPAPGSTPKKTPKSDQ
ncbi:hypothetical protein DFS34DRAFT_59959 [Phlyctochytrium arcticum]|nr:hypothetical protein DFS34DRAFT_59959 [Phlyctochytrium arcticum]